jgi:hypothetical protein
MRHDHDIIETDDVPDRCGHELDLRMRAGVSGAPGQVDGDRLQTQSPRLNSEQLPAPRPVPGTVEQHESRHEAIEARLLASPPRTYSALSNRYLRNSRFTLPVSI